MKILFVLLAAVAGLAAGLQFPLSYEYRYTGEVKTGIHELRNQYSGAALRATVKVSVVSSSEAHVQILDPEVGSMNGDVSSAGRDPLPISHMVPLHDKAALEQSFKLHFSGQREKLEVPSTEMLWISNLRKSIVSLLRVPFVMSSPSRSVVNLVKNKISSRSDVPKSFKKREETIHGKCAVTYTLTKAAPSNVLYLKELSEDAELPRGKSVYRLYRSVDFFDCADRVVLEKASHGNLSMAGVGQVRGFQSRSSVGEYLLTGEPTSEFSMRVEEAVVEGIVTMNPFGYETKKLMAVTNQTLSLVRSTHDLLVRAPSSPMKEETWAFRVESPYKKAPSSPSWVSFKGEGNMSPMYPEKDFTGYRLTPQLREQLKSQIKNAVESIIRQVRQPNELVKSSFGGSLDGAAVQKLESVVSRLRALTHSDITELYNHIAAPSKSSPPASKEQIIKRELFISALKASGSSPAIKVILEKIISNDIGPIEASNIFVSMTSNIANPAIITDLIEYVISLPEDAPIALKSSALINLSSMVRRLCIKSAGKSFHYPSEMMGESVCSHEAVFSKLIHHLRTELKKTTKNYLRAIYIQSLANIGEISCVRDLAEIAEGLFLKDQLSLRLLAIQGLSKNHMRNTSYPLAQSALLSIAEAQVEDSLIREGAIASLFTFPQNATFWQRMALSTWREPSPRVSSFIYSVIKSLANSNDPHFINKISMAKHVLPQCKPQPVSPYYSAMSMTSSYHTREDLSATLQSMYLASSSSQIPEQLAMKALSVLGGMKIPLIHWSSIGKGLERPLWSILDKLRGMTESRHTGQNPDYRRSVEEMESITEGHKSLNTPESDRELFAHLTVLKNIELFAPITRESLEQLYDPKKSMIANIYEKLMTNKSMLGLSYYNPVDITLIMPNDLGLPIITQVSRPSFLFSDVAANCETIPRAESPHQLYSVKFANLTGQAVTKIVLKSETSMKVLVPWNNMTVVSGIDGETTFSLPAKFFLSFDRRSKQKSLQFGVWPLLTSESPVLMTRMLPFTLLRPLFPTNDVTQQSVKPIHVTNDKPYYKSELPLPKEASGIDVSVQYQGDVEFPINVTTIKEVIIEPLKLVKLLVNPTTRQYQMSLIYRPQSSPTKQVTGTFNYAPITFIPNKPSRPDMPLVENLSADDTMQQRIQKLSQLPVPVVSMWSASLNLSGTRPSAKYELAMITFPTQELTEEQQVPTRRAQFQFNAMKSNPRSPTPSNQICVCNSVEYPLLTPMTPISELLESSLPSSLVSKIYAGRTCTRNSHSLEIKGIQEVSSERREMIMKMEGSDQLPLPLDPTQAVKTTAVYDRLNIEIRKLKTFSATAQNLTVHMSDFVHGYLFPLVHHNSVNVQGKPDLVIMNGTRSLVTDRYVFWTHTPHSVCLAQDLKVPAFLDYVSPLNGYLRQAQPEHRRSQSSHSSQSSLEEPTTNTCILEGERVKTFAGLRYQKMAMPCNQIAVKGESGDNDKFVILTKQGESSAPAEQEIKIIYPKEALVIFMRKLEIFVNGKRVSESQKEVKSANGQVIARIVQSNEQKMVTIPHRFSVLLAEGRTVSIKMDQRYRSKVQGLCGKYTQEKMSDMQDSQGCFFTERIGSLYTAAWVAASEVEQCKSRASPSLKDVFTRCEKYQEHCPKSLSDMAKLRRPRH